jgi:ABC-type nitrate/sulfonate/bicarbonate transport system permease component
MSDVTTHPSRARVALPLLLAVLALAAVGALAGAVWNWLWTPTSGVVYDHRWTAGDALGLQHQFSSTGWYVVVAAVAGLVAGIAVSLVVDRVPLLTLVAVVVGSALAAWVMLVVGTALGPPDPATAAKTADDGTRLPEHLDVSGRSPFIAFPVGALLGLVLVFIGLSSRVPPQASVEPARDPETAG